MSTPSSPCAACKFLRRKCTQECVYAPYFPPDQPQKFANVHKVFGASNVSKLLNELSTSQREDAVNSLAFEAEARLRDPVYGCVGLISILQHRLKEMQNDLYNAKKELSHYIGPQALLPSTIQSTTYNTNNNNMAQSSSSLIQINNGLPMMGGGQQYQPPQQQQQQNNVYEGQQLAAALAVRQQQEMLRMYNEEQQNQQQEIVRFNRNYDEPPDSANNSGFNQITVALGNYDTSNYHIQIQSQQVDQHQQQQHDDHNHLEAQLFLQPTTPQPQPQHHHHHQPSASDDGGSIGPSC